MIHGYCYSDNLNPYWNKSRGSQPEILNYLQDVTDKHNLRSHCVFGTSVTKAEWDGHTSLWHITIVNKKGESSIVSAKIFVSAMGILVEPNIPAIRGAEKFKGPAYHSARYRHDVDLREKKVAVIGNGCTACVLPLNPHNPSVQCHLVPKSFPLYPKTPQSM